MPGQKEADGGCTAASQRCHNCRVRRLVCDQALPGCRKCASRGVECPGYGRNLRWVQPSDKTEGSKPLVKRARGRPRLQLMDSGSQDGAEIEVYDDETLRPFPNENGVGGECDASQW